MPIFAKHRITTIENKLWNASADTRLIDVSIKGSAECQIRSPDSSDRLVHQIMVIEANPNGTPFSKPVCRSVRPYDFIICGCHNWRPLLTAVLPASATPSTKTLLFHNTRQRKRFPGAPFATTA